MLAKSLTVIGKLFLILVISASAHAQSWDKPRPNELQSNYTLMGMIWNFTLYHVAMLEPDDSNHHTLAVYHALDNAENDQIVEWFNERTESSGKVQVLMTWPTSGMICRRISHNIRIKNKEKDYQETACRPRTNNSRWVFADK
jgi:surface antigen